MFYKSFVKPLLDWLSRNDPEIAHDITLGALKMINDRKALLRFLRWSTTPSTNEHLVQNLLGMRFPNPIGLAAGFDKNCAIPQAISAFGFGFIEVGTITRFAQSGNPRPRTVRFPEHHALVNAMGFPNHGESLIKLSLAQKPFHAPIPVGISIGKSKITPLERAFEEYRYLLRSFYDIGDYIAVNISSPNTISLRLLQTREYFNELARALIEEREHIITKCGAARKPILIKISPDLTWEERDDILAVCQDRDIDGIIAVNTTLDHSALNTGRKYAGGLSGQPLLARALNTVRYIRTHMPKDFIVIGVGGIRTAEDAYHMFCIGADLVQFLTGGFDEGPFLPKRLARGLYTQMKRDGIANLKQLREARCRT